MKPESLMMSHGYKPELSQGAVKCPVFLTSTFVFQTAEEGKDFFEVAYGHRKSRPNEELGLIYSRINNPNLEILEDRLSLWDKADGAAVFESGMSAISTVLLEFLKPGSLLLYSAPVYGGTHHFIHHVLTKFGIDSVEFVVNDSKEDILEKIKASGKEKDLAMIYIETPANPTNDLFDITEAIELAKHFSTESNKVHVAVDNTYLGPIWQKPLELGADVRLGPDDLNLLGVDVVRASRAKNLQRRRDVQRVRNRRHRQIAGLRPSHHAHRSRQDPRENPSRLRPRARHSALPFVSLFLVVA